MHFDAFGLFRMVLWLRRRRRRRAPNTPYRRLFPARIFRNQQLFQLRYRADSMLLMSNFCNYILFFCFYLSYSFIMNFNKSYISLKFKTSLYSWEHSRMTMKTTLTVFKKNKAIKKTLTYFGRMDTIKMKNKKFKHTYHSSP